ncbi:hypothetical protein [Enterococcus innesii]|uniref:hypothetical protein n=1 Tax=Enterococcus innesii TaxID=2839759 RepID=UPI003BDDA55E
MSKKQELKNYVVNSIVHNAFDPNELLRLINLLPDQPQLNENQKSIEEYVEMAIVQLREANLILNKVYEKDRFAREIQNDISEIMDTLKCRYFEEQEEE